MKIKGSNFLIIIVIIISFLSYYVPRNIIFPVYEVPFSSWMGVALYHKLTYLGLLFTILSYSIALFIVIPIKKYWIAKILTAIFVLLELYTFFEYALRSHVSFFKKIAVFKKDYHYLFIENELPKTFINLDYLFVCMFIFVFLILSFFVFRCVYKIYHVESDEFNKNDIFLVCMLPTSILSFFYSIPNYLYGHFYICYKGTYYGFWRNSNAEKGTFRQIIFNDSCKLKLKYFKINFASDPVLTIKKILGTPYSWNWNCHHAISVLFDKHHTQTFNDFIKTRILK